MCLLIVIIDLVNAPKLGLAVHVAMGLLIFNNGLSSVIQSSFRILMPLIYPG